MKVQLKPNEPVKFHGKRWMSTADKPAVLDGTADELKPLVEAGIATEIKTKEPTK